MSFVHAQHLHYPIHQFLTPDGVLSAQTPPRWRDPVLWRAAYRHLSLTRLFDQRAVALQRTGQLGTYASCLGQEAISSAIGFSLQNDDVFIPYYRDQAAQMLRGMSMCSILQFWGGDEWGSHHTSAFDLPACIPIATQVTHAAGVAAAIKLRHQQQAALTTCGDGASSRGDFYEALNLAGVWHLPLVVVINNNQWAISVPLSQQTASATLAQKAVAAGITGIRVDGNDFLALMAVLDEALARARTGKGATLIEAVTYRLCDHTTADDMSRYANPAERQQAEQSEPLRRLRILLEEHGGWDNPQQQLMEQELLADIGQQVAAYLQLAAANVNDMFDYVYAALPADLAEQKVAFHQRRGSMS